VRGAAPAAPAAAPAATPASATPASATPASATPASATLADTASADSPAAAGNNAACACNTASDLDDSECRDVAGALRLAADDRSSQREHGDADGNNGAAHPAKAEAEAAREHLRSDRLTIAGWREQSRVPVRVTLCTGIMLLAATWTGGAPAKGLAPVVKPTQELAALLSTHKVRSKPTKGSAVIGVVQVRRPITEERTVLPVLGHSISRDGLRWLRVRLPGRPNGRTGWISRRGTAAWRTSWHIVVYTSSRRVAVYKSGTRVRVFKAVVGSASTPTPRGAFFVEESLLLPANAVGAPFALALSARSNVLQQFAGGPGQIALHGLSNVGGTPGTAVSHGCVRLDNGVMRWLVARIGPGTPVTITQ
jgi:hypothetical protein